MESQHLYGRFKAGVNLELYTIGASRTNSWYNIFVKINTEVIKYFNLSLIFRCNLSTSSKHDFHEIHIGLVSIRVSSKSFSPMNLNYGINVSAIKPSNMHINGPSLKLNIAFKGFFNIIINKLAQNNLKTFKTLGSIFFTRCTRWKLNHFSDGTVRF